MKFTIICILCSGRSIVTHVSDLNQLRNELDRVCNDLVRLSDFVVSFYVLNNSSILSTGVL